MGKYIFLSLKMEPPAPIPGNFDLLPDETIMNILFKIGDFDTLTNWCQTSKRINNICQDNFFWKRKYKKDYGNIPSLPKVSWKEKYKFNYSARRTSPISADTGGYSIVDDQGIMYMAGKEELGLTFSRYTGLCIKTITLKHEPAVLEFGSKIISVSFTEFPSALTADGDVYVIQTESVYAGRFRKVKLSEKIIKLSSRGKGVITKTNRIFVNIIGSPQLIPIHGIDISISGGRYAIISTDGKLYMWGNISFGRNNRNFTKEPKHIPLPESVKQVSLGTGHIAVLSITGNLYLWGESGYGELGLGKIAASKYDNVYTEPQKLMLQEPVSHVVCGGGYTAAITENGKLYMWGQDPNDIIDPEGAAHYRRDDHEDRPIVDSPVHVDIGHPVTSIALEFEYAIAVTDDGVVNLWGQDGLELIPEPDFL